MMKISLKHLILTALAILISIPSWAVFDEKNLGQTLSELRLELYQEINSQSTSMSRIDERDNQQKKEMLNLVMKCNELSLMLYSQKQDCTFDLTYALKQVTAEYDRYTENRLPFEDLMARLSLEIDRYARLVETLRRLPPQLQKIEELPDNLAYHNDSVLDAGLRVREMMLKEKMDNMGRIIDSLNFSRQLSAFLLNPKEMEDRDSCIHYAITLLKLYSEIKDKVVEDKTHYEDARIRIQEAYDYAQDRYKTLQKTTFTQKQENYLTGVLANFKSYKERTLSEAARKYAFKSRFHQQQTESAWKGPLLVKFFLSILLGFIEAMIFSFAAIYLISFLLKKYKKVDIKDARTRLSLLGGMIVFAIMLFCFALAKKGSFVSMASTQLLTYCWMVIAILVSILFRLRGKRASSTLLLYFPLILLGLLVILLRIVFISDMMMNLFFPPLLSIAFILMTVSCITTKGNTEKIDRTIGWISVTILFFTTTLSLAGYVFISIILIIWWLFMVSLIETIFAIIDLTRLYEQKVLKRRAEVYQFKKRDTGIKGCKDTKEELFNVTWFDDMLNICILPVMTVASIPFSVHLALDVFDMHDIFHAFMTTPFFDIHNPEGEPMLQMTVLKIVVASSLFFIFRYISYAIKSLFRGIKIAKYLRDNGVSVMSVTDVNFTLTNNIIAIIVWFVYAVTLILLLKIPVGAISMVATGLAAGIGLALKDVINNFIYGIQLMSGRLRVGDWIDVNDVRGKVEEISYQSTQIETIDGATMSFLNSDLFSRNFRNLTKSDKYELIQIYVGVGYGSNMDEVRAVILEALSKLQVKDSYGRDIVDKSRETTVMINDLGACSIDLSIWQYVLVSQKYEYESKARELIYVALSEHNIEMPFPQTDVHIKQ